MDFQLLVECVGVNEANKYAKDGWVLVKVICTDSGPRGPYQLYIMGLPRD